MHRTPLKATGGTEMAIGAAPIAAGFAGAILLYSGLKGKGVAASIRSILAGQNPSGLPQDTPLSSTSDVAAAPGSPLADGGSTFNSQVPTTPQISGSAATNQNTGKLLATPYGWSSGPEWDALVKLWTRESGWSNTADNPSSHAYGIAQALPSTKYPIAGRPPSEGGSSSASSQISWGLQYIKGRYGSPTVAWEHETSIGWY